MVMGWSKYDPIRLRYHRYQYRIWSISDMRSIVAKVTNFWQNCKVHSVPPPPPLSARAISWYCEVLTHGPIPFMPPPPQLNGCISFALPAVRVIFLTDITNNSLGCHYRYSEDCLNDRRLWPFATCTLEPLPLELYKLEPCQTYEQFITINLKALDKLKKSTLNRWLDIWLRYRTCVLDMFLCSNTRYTNLCSISPFYNSGVPTPETTVFGPAKNANINACLPRYTNLCSVGTRYCNSKVSNYNR